MLYAFPSKMLPLVEYFLKQTKRNVILIILTILLPALLPYIMYALFTIFGQSSPPANSKSVRLQNLPAQTTFPDNSENFIYFSYSPDTPNAKFLVDELISVNNLAGAKTLAFTTVADANSYFATKNIQDNIPSFNSTIAKEVFCVDSEEFTKESCNSAFLDTVEADLTRFYTFTPTGDNEIFIHIDLLEQGAIQTLPENLTVSLIFNTSMLNNLIKQHPDELSKKQNTLQPFWTSYGTTLQTQIDQILVKKLTAKTITYSFQHLDPIPFTGQVIPSTVFFSMSVQLGYAVSLVLTTILSTVNREQSHVVLRRLGVSEGVFWLYNFVFTGVPVLISGILQAFIWKYTGIPPFAGVDLLFGLIVSIMVSFILISFSCLISVLFGGHKSPPTISACVFAFGILIIPTVFSILIPSLFDQSLVQNFAIWLSIFIIPLFSIPVIIDGLKTAGPQGFISISKFKFFQFENGTPAKYIFTDYMNYSSQIRVCATSSVSDVCTFKIPMYWIILLVAFVQSVILVPLFIVLLAHWLPEKGHRGLPFLFFAKKSFYRRKSGLSGGFKLEGVTAGYKKRMVLKELNMDINQNQVCALVAESGSGKSTILSIIAGEKRIKSGQIQVLGLDLTDDINAYHVRPYIGLCPQDLSNVWMNNSVLDNVSFSLKIRAQMTNKNIENQAEIVQNVLIATGLGAKPVQIRNAKSLSGGMLRRLAFCNALVGSDFLLLDEISAGVDPVLKRSIWRVLEQFTGTVIITSHDMSEVQEMAQTVTILNEGKSVANNINQFDLRGSGKSYNISLYKAGIVNNQDFQNLAEALDIEVKMVRAQQHVLQVTIQEEITTEQLLGTYDQLSSFVEKNGFDDYQVNKSSIQDIYVKLINYQPDQHDDQDDFNAKTPKGSIFLALLRKCVYNDYKNQKIPILAVLTVVCIIISIIVRVLQSVIDDQKKTRETPEVRSRQKNIADPCFQGCLVNAGATKAEKIQACFSTRTPASLFAKSSAADKPYCANYLSYLGLDRSQKFVLGDGSQSLSDFAYQFAVKSKDVFQPTGSFEVPSTGADYPTLYADIYDPLTKTANDGILPYILSQRVKMQNEDCSQQLYCSQLCGFFMQSFIACQEPFDIGKCILSCGNHCNATSQINVQGQDFYSVNSHKEAISNYRKISDFSFSDISYNKTEFNVNKVMMDLNKFLISGIFDVTTDTDTDMKVDISTILPFVGTVGDFYDQNSAYLLFNSLPKYTCKGTYTAGAIPQIQQLQLQTIQGARNSKQLYTNKSQLLPDRSNVQLMNLGSQPQIQFTGGVLRKFLFKSATDYSPWKFNYQFVTQEMPNFANPVPLVSPIKQRSALSTFSSMEFSVTGMLPLVLAALQVGKEFDIEANRLYQLHGVSPNRWAGATLFYFFTQSLLIFVINIIVVLIFCSFVIIGNDQGLTVLFQLLQCILSVPTGIILAVLAKKSKPASMASFFIVIFTLVFQMMGLSGKPLTIIITVFIPAYGFVFQQFLTVSNQSPDSSVIIVSIVCVVLQICLIFLLINKDLIIAKFRNKSQKASQSDIESSQLDPTLALQIQNVSHTYDKKNYALKNVSINIKKQEVFGLLGANGSGKSTLVHCLTGIYRPTSGAAFCNNVNLFNSETVSSTFSIVPQRDILFDNLTVLDHLVIFTSMNVTNQPSINDIISQMQLSKIAKTKISDLSEGTKRKVSFSLALAANPQIIALDEPSCGLGATTKLIVQDAVFKLIKTGRTVVLTSHDMEEVEALCDSCVIMKDGLVIKQGEIHDIRNANNVEFVLILKVSEEKISELEKEFEAQGLGFHRKMNEIGKFFVFEMAKGSDKKMMIAALQKCELDGENWVIEGIRLEEVFLDVVGGDDEEGTITVKQNQNYGIRVSNATEMVLHGSE